LAYHLLLDPWLRMLNNSSLKCISQQPWLHSHGCTDVFAQPQLHSRGCTAMAAAYHLAPRTSIPAAKCQKRHKTEGSASQSIVAD